MVGIGRVGAVAAAMLLSGASAVYMDKASDLPIVDLGYQIQRAANFNVRV